MTETVLVTGGSGYVAGWCIAGLLRGGHMVRTTLRDPSKEAQLRTAIRSAGVSDTGVSVVITVTLVCCICAWRAKREWRMMSPGSLLYK